MGSLVLPGFSVSLLSPATDLARPETACHRGAGDEGPPPSCGPDTSHLCGCFSLKKKTQTKPASVSYSQGDRKAMPFIKQRVLRTRVPPCTAALGLSTHTPPPPHPHTLICNTEYRFPCQGLSCSDFWLSLLNRLVHLTATSRPFLLRSLRLASTAHALLSSKARDLRVCL